jgi:hypothetical protein
MLEAEIAGSKGQLVVEDPHSGSFSEREALLPRHSLRVRSSRLSWYAVACSSVLRYVCGCGTWQRLASSPALGELASTLCAD